MPNIFDQMAASDAAAGAPAQAQAGNVFDQMAKQDRQSQDGAMQAALGDAVKILPDQAANDQQMAKTLGLPVDMVERNRDQVQQQFRLRELQQVMQASPVLRAQMSNPDFARVAHDDAPVLNDLEQVMQFLGRSGKATLAGVAGISEGLWGLGRAASGYIPDAAGGRLLEDWTTYGNQQARGVVQRLMPQAGGTVEAGWYSGMQSLGMNLGQLPLAFLPGGQAPLAENIAGQVATRMSPVLWSMGLTTGGQAYGEARDKGLTQAQAIMFGTSQGVIEAGTEMIGMPALFNVLKPGKTAAKIMEYMIKEQGGEQIATALQDMNEWAVLPENQGKSFGDYLRARPSAALQTAIATAVGGGAQVTLMKGAGMVINRAEYAAAKAQQAEAQAALLDQLNKVAQASSLQKRDADTFGALAEQQAAEYGASDTVYIDGNALMQSGLAQQVAQVSPAVAAQVQEAAATGGLVAIPTSEYAARIAPLQESAQLLDHLKFDPEGFTRSEAQVYMQTQGEQLQAEVDRALAVAEQTDAARAGMEAVRTQVLDQLNEANRFKPEVNGAYASLIAARYAVRAEQMGTTADELFKQRGLRVVAEGMPGVSLDQPAWHGTPHRGIEKTGFKLTSIGTGEGAQSFGWGMYFAGERKVAEQYRNRLTSVGAQKTMLLDGVALAEGTPARHGASLLFHGSKRETVASVKQWLNSAKEGDVGLAEIASKAGMAPETYWQQVLDFVQNHTKKQISEEAGQTYSVEVPSDADLLDYGKPFSQQSEKVQEALRKVHGGDAFAESTSAGADTSGEGLYQALVSDLGSPRAASEALLAAGIPGLRYLDGNSRGRGAGSHNYVIWDERLLTPEAAQIKALYQGARAPQTESQEFKSWFGDSKVVDDNGKPLVVYHGTGSEFSVFDEDLAGKNYEKDDEQGFFFTSKPKEAYWAADRASEVSGGNPSIMPVYLSLQDPLIIDVSEHAEKVGLGDPSSYYDNRTSELLARANDAGNDGIIVRNKRRGYSTIVAFNPEQIKSAIGNNGQFDPNNPSILKQGADGPRGMFSPEQRAIALLKAADLSTFLHEAGHFFFEDDIALASELVAAQAQGATVSPGEQRILDDVGTLLTWHGLKGDLSQQLAEWHGLGFEERRAYHEKTAESFERYLLEGKAPSLELTPMFQRFRTWLVSVYRSLKDFVAGHPAAGELSPEVRQVFDRMLASEDQIALALQGRSLVPMFASAEEAGMTPEEFARYQESGRQATADAVDSLQARGIRDMQWLRNARSRMLKAKQKEAAGLRAGLETDARVEVYGEPIYRAWRFLTAKLREEDKLPEPVKTGTGQTLDPGKDSLLVAVAKLGGLDRESAAEHLGVHADDFKAKSGVFGAPVFRKTGGLAADAMAERLAESGYLKADDALNVLEDKIASELRGDPQYSFAKDWAAAQGEQRAGDGVDVSALGAARLDAGELAVMGLPPEVVNTLKARKMVAANGLHPDLVAEQFGFTSGDELVRKLALAEPPQERIDALVDVRMLEQHGELASPEAIERATDEAIHNEARMRMVATEEATLAKATGKPRVLEKAAREYAAQLIARQKVRDLRPSQYTNAESRAAAEAAKARKAGDTARAAAEKRNQLLQGFIASTALKARDEMQQAVDYLRRFDKPSKTLDKDYADQIDQLLERFDLKPVSNKASEKRMALSRWMDSQREQGLEPEIPQELLDAAERKPWRELTVEEMRGLVDTVKQIEHLGRLKHRLLTARDQKAYEAVRDEIAASIREHAGKRKANARTSTTWAGKALSGVKMFGASHIKAATWARVLDGGKDGGPMWEHFVRGANERGDMEATMRAEATSKLAEIMAPLFKLGRMSDKGTFFPTVGRSFNRQERLAIALNIGNDGNLQRLLGGEGWTVDQLKPVLQSLTAAEWHAVQAIWDHFETYRPQIAAKERRVYGKEPAWVEPRAFDVTTADGQNVSLRGGYYPIKYDPAASQRAEEHADAEGAQRQLRGAYTSATTRRSFTKARVEEVNGRPLLYSLAGVYGGVNDVIHDLAWHEWLIDTNRLLRSQTIDSAIRDHYGPEAKQQLKTWAQDIAEGDRGAQHALDMALGRLRQGISVAGLGFNFVSAAMQPLGITQSIVRVGTPWIGRGVMRYVANPVRATREANQLSAFMENRARTRFRELNELRNQVQDQTSVKEFTGRWAYWMMMRFQQMVDVPTWWGAYDKAIAEGNADERARALADQAVIDSQGGGETKDLSAIERGGSAQRLFTVFYSFMNTALNIGVAQGMTANTPAKKAKLAVDMLLIYTVPAVLGALFKDAITPGDAGDDDPEKLARKLAAEQISFLLGLFVVGREFADVGKIIAGAEGARDYAGPAGTRMVGDTLRFGKQAMQGEFDDAFRKAAINLSGDLFGLPAAQVNRTITGAKALVEGETSNPAALAFGFQKPR